MIADTVVGADLQFDAAAHEYRTPSGLRVPSVTEILSGVGISTDFEALGAQSSRVADAIRHKRDLGHALHADAHAFDDDDLDWSTVHADVEPYLRAWQTFRANTGIRPLARERRVFHPTVWFAGTLDGLFVTPKGLVVLVDLKTGDPTDSGCQWQTAAYAAAYRLEHPGFAIHGRWGVQLKPAATVPYAVHPYSDFRDWLEFQAFATTYRCQAARRGRKG